MTEYHTIYKGPEGESTQWDDIQRKLGNAPPKVRRGTPRFELGAHRDRTA